jgi:hypothetical protein
MANTQYDPGVIQEFADRLYRQANLMAVLYGVLGAVIGAFAGFVVGQPTDLSGLAALMGAGLFGGLGAAAGVARAFTLKLQAQTALCQKRIEENTRTGAAK